MQHKRMLSATINALSLLPRRGIDNVVPFKGCTLSFCSGGHKSATNIPPAGRRDQKKWEGKRGICGKPLHGVEEARIPIKTIKLHVSRRGFAAYCVCFNSVKKESSIKRGTVVAILRGKLAAFSNSFNYFAVTFNLSWQRDTCQYLKIVINRAWHRSSAPRVTS